jgi:patatin-related protein
LRLGLNGCVTNNKSIDFSFKYLYNVFEFISQYQESKMISNTLMTGESTNVLEEAPLLEKETRFAVVMYGGVSLAIYIYGVTVELYKMVRATARRPEDEDRYLLEWNELDPVEKVYRKLGKALKTKFVIDILSGTSAGGINAVYLAKALANAQSIGGLKDIWLNQGNIAKLINDKKSEVVGLQAQNPPLSLLNSQRMYFYLLKALHEMDIDKPERDISPFVEELDLYITATDLRGLTVDLPVANAIVRESRFRNIFRFHYSTRDAAGREVDAKDETDARNEYSNDFIKENNPFLAYVARCTSSFPFAFEPMQLEDIKNVLNTEDFKEYKYKPGNWVGFYKDYEKAGDDFSKRSFGDGGYLDNKPFSYATEALLRRRADRVVDRKLIYIDPSPEHPTSANIDQKPDAFQNVLAALLSIPRYEPIREDLEKVIERNQLIQRVNNIISQINLAPVLKGKDKMNLKDWQKYAKDWANKYFDREFLDWFGISYVTYHQLRVANVLEGLRSSILRACNWNETGKSAENLDILLEGWRHAYYTTDPQFKETHRSENDLLFRLDMNWRMRRLLFVQNVINKLLKAFYSSGEDSTPDERKKILMDAQQIIDTSGVKLDISKLDENDARRELTEIKKELNIAYGHLRAGGRKIRSQSLLEGLQDDAQLSVYVKELSEFKKYLEVPDSNTTGQIHLDVLAEKAGNRLGISDSDESELGIVFDKIEKISCALAEHLPNKDRKGYICQSLSLVSSKVKSALGNAPAQKGEKDNRTLLQKCLSYYHDRFEYYDMLIFPVYYGTGVEESDEAEIIRISPEDATNLVNEKGVSEKKLAGTALANFGAFFAREWRENDMMWGRLDAAECLIKALQIEGDDRKNLIDEIQQAILQDELTSRDVVKVYQAKNEVEKAESEKILLDKYKSRYGSKDGQAEWLYEAIHRLSTPEKLLQNFRNGYSINREFPPKDTLLVGTRAMRVLGNLLNGLSSSHKSFSAPAKLITSAGSIIAGILAVVLPNSLGNFLVAGYWIWLLYIFEILLGGVGWLFGARDIQQIGISSFAITLTAHLTLTFMNKWLDGRVNPKFIRILVSALIILLIVGVLFVGYVGLLSLGVFNIPNGLFGQWLRQVIKS